MFLLGGLIVMLVSQVSKSNAQSPLEQAVQQQLQIERDQAQKLKARQMELERSSKTPPSGAGQGVSRKPRQRISDKKCFPVNQVVIDGATLIKRSNIVQVTAPYEGKCIGIGAIDQLIRELTYLYIERGYITSRVYVPEQDLKTKQLNIAVVEGQIEAIIPGKKSSIASSEIETAFPGLKKRPLNLRDLEQGVDQMNRLPSNDVRTQIHPGKKPGGSVVEVHNVPEKRWRLTINGNNLGQESTGRYATGASLELDNLLRLNDLFSFSYDRGTPSHPANFGAKRKISNSYSANFSVPYGYWTFALDGTHFNYLSQTKGLFQTIDTSGESTQLRGTMANVLHRDQTSKTLITTGLTWKKNKNFVLGDLLETGSRTLSIGTLGVTHSNRVWGGVLSFDASVEQGLAILGALEDPYTFGAPDEAANDNALPKAQFTKITGTLSFYRPFEFAGGNFAYSGYGFLQLSPDHLFGSEQIAIGGHSSVRGVRESVLFGNRGFLTRNELIWRLPQIENSFWRQRIGQLLPFVALDYGHVIKQRRFEIEGGSLFGWAAGIRASQGNMTFELSYADLLYKSRNIETDSGEFAVKLGVHF